MQNFDKEYVGGTTVGAGLVKIVIDAAGIPIKVEIDDMIFNSDDKQMISDVFCAAYKEAYDKLKEDMVEYYQKTMKGLYGNNLNYPGKAY